MIEYAEGPLVQELLRVRAYFEQMRDDRLLAQFPNGCCKSASFILAHHLMTTGALMSIEYVWGLRGSPPHQWPHGWLESEGLILDLTADQFPEIFEPVIVTRDPKFHDSFAPLGGRFAYPDFWTNMKQTFRERYDTAFQHLTQCLGGKATPAAGGDSVEPR